MSTIILLICDRADCEARAEVDLGGDLPANESVHTIVDTAAENGWLEAGWGVDLASNNLDRVIHCPVHRT